MIENIKEIAKIIRENSESINSPYSEECEDFRITFFTNRMSNDIWLYMNTKWECACKHEKHAEILKKAFNAKEVRHIEKPGFGFYSYWAVRLK